jgi:hypothetical protein
VAAALVAGACVACAPRAPVVSDGEGAELVGSLEVEVAGDSARLTLHATNPGPEPLRLEFTSTQRADFEIWTLDGQHLWTWSADRSFAQVVSEEVLPAGATVREQAAWSVGGAGGEYIAVARLVSRTAPVELRARFRVAGN